VCHFILENTANNMLCACGRRFPTPDEFRGHITRVSQTGNPNPPQTVTPSTEGAPPQYDLNRMTRM
jgi:hypothetical protein